MGRPQSQNESRLESHRGLGGGSLRYPLIRSLSSNSQRLCLSCGVSIGLRRRYCSIACRQQLHTKLERRTGLLSALNIRYATFYFSSSIIVLTLLPFNSREIFSFIHPRRKADIPGDAFCRLADQLSNSWWRENRKTQRRYIANRSILEMASRKIPVTEPVRPREVQRPAMVGNSLTRLKLSQADLCRPDCVEAIKRAFRTQALRHHPDKGGRAEIFRKVFDAYRDLLVWAENPAFATRIGFPDRWFYDGYRNRWLQPIPGTHSRGEMGNENGRL